MNFEVRVKVCVILTCIVSCRGVAQLGGSSTELFLVGPIEVNARKSFRLTVDSLKVGNK